MLDVQIGSYRIIDKLAEGGMGEVYIARHTSMDRDAVVKVLHLQLSCKNDVIERFFNDARAAASIHHPGIVEVFDFGHADGRAFIIMERLRGETLAARVAKAPLDTDKALIIACQLARALGAAHDKGIVHRDLKPENIFIVPDPEVQGGERAKILDFGVAKLADPHSPSKTIEGSLFGTPAYMAPEQCANAADADHRADIYALGCILYELLCGDPPFGRVGLEAIASHLHDDPAPLRSRAPSVPADLDEIIMRLLDKDPDRRFQNCGALIKALEHVHDQLPGRDSRKSSPVLDTAPGAPGQHTHLDNTNLGTAKRDRKDIRFAPTLVSSNSSHSAATDTPGTRQSTPAAGTGRVSATPTELQIAHAHTLLPEDTPAPQDSLSAPHTDSPTVSLRPPGRSSAQQDAIASDRADSHLSSRSQENYGGSSSPGVRPDAGQQVHNIHTLSPQAPRGRRSPIQAALIALAVLLGGGTAAVTIYDQTIVVREQQITARAQLKEARHALDAGLWEDAAHHASRVIDLLINDPDSAELIEARKIREQVRAEQKNQEIYESLKHAAEQNQMGDLHRLIQDYSQMGPGSAYVEDTSNALQRLIDQKLQQAREQAQTDRNKCKRLQALDDEIGALVSQIEQLPNITANQLRELQSHIDATQSQNCQQHADKAGADGATGSKNGNNASRGDRGTKSGKSNKSQRKRRARRARDNANDKSDAKAGAKPGATPPAAPPPATKPGQPRRDQTEPGRQQPDRQTAPRKGAQQFVQVLDREVELAVQGCFTRLFKGYRFPNATAEITISVTVASSGRLERVTVEPRLAKRLQRCIRTQLHKRLPRPALRNASPGTGSMTREYTYSVSNGSETPGGW